ncbi:MAG: glycosyltransferase family 8 protein [Hallerella succinigenes]|uniref:glycosyltransferase family 8 protein n=1 Tax=Hallerella succinigenes TaxID=1896222 RepID=UPI0023F146B8|nr:glycosyltransferase family 8 protein [Hallerella succinigenes]MDD6090897.1 glycosyltransferase family 8 protein [Hallerella succinigenes]
MQYMTTPNQYNIVCGIDDKYVRPLTAMLQSLFEHCCNGSCSVFILSLDVQTKNKDLITAWVNSKGHRIQFIDINKKALDFCPIQTFDSISIATYLRLLTPEILPKHIDKVLYLDTDIIIQKDIEDLYEEDLNGIALAAVEDAPNESVVAKEIFPAPYFNAGVILLNLNFLRATKFTEHAFRYIKSNPDKLSLHDQDVLNALLHDKAKFLSIQWNLLDCYYNDPPKIQTNKRSALKIALSDPAIIHFSGSIKPWHVECEHPLSHLFKKYLPKIKLKSQSLKLEHLYKFPKYQRFLLKLHVPFKIIRRLDPIAHTVWNFLYQRHK